MENEKCDADLPRTPTQFMRSIKRRKTMDNLVSDYIGRLKIGPIKKYKHVAVAPLFTDVKPKFDYIVLKEAIKKNLVVVTEVDEHGSVPELMVVNSSAFEVLTLDGEELLGAKQNRVLNTSILLRGNSETLIPVSCTEAGRWAQTSAAFMPSQAMMGRIARSRKVRSVSDSLMHLGRHASDQQEVWGEVDRMLEVAGASSGTAAMHDLYTEKRDNLADYSLAFQHETGQIGSVVFVNGEAVGFDVVSQESEYENVHRQILESYVIDALSMEKREVQPEPKAAAAFLKEAVTCNEERHEAVSQGYDYRYTSDKMVGSVLGCHGEVIHAAFFRNDDSADSGGMAGSSMREFFRRFGHGGQN